MFYVLPDGKVFERPHKAAQAAWQLAGASDIRDDYTDWLADYDLADTEHHKKKFRDLYIDRISEELEALDATPNLHGFPTLETYGMSIYKCSTPTGAGLLQSWLAETWKKDLKRARQRTAYGYTLD